MKVTERETSMRNKMCFGAVYEPPAAYAGASVALAHDRVEHVMGTVSAVTETSISVDTVKHTAVTIVLNPSTQFTHHEASASRKDLQGDDRVVVSVRQSSEKKLVAISVKWGANASTSHADHGEHEK